MLVLLVTVALLFPAGGLLTLFALIMGFGLFVAPKPSIVVLALFLVVQSPLVILAGSDTPLALAIQRADEAMTVAGAARVVLLAVWGQGWRVLRTPVLWLAGFLAVGALSSLANAVPLKVVALGAFLSVKFGILLCLALSVQWSERDARRLVSSLLILGPTLLATGLLRYALPGDWQQVLTLPADRGVSYARGGFDSMKGPFIHPGLFGWAMALIGCYGFAAVLNRRRGAGVLAVATSLIGIVASLRRKPLGGLAMGAISSLGRLDARRRLLALLLLLGMGIGIWTVGRKRVVATINDAVASYVDPYAPTTARGLLYLTGWEIGLEHAPLGAGFGRFGGFASRLYYSPLYDQYGLSHVFGLSRAAPQFIEDTYWPHILAETGWGGVVLLLGFMAWVWIRVRRGLDRAATPDVRILVIGASAALIEALVESVAGPFFESSLPAFAIAIPLGMAIVLTQLPESPTQGP